MSFQKLKKKHYERKNIILLQGIISAHNHSTYCKFRIKPETIPGIPEQKSNLWQPVW